MNFLKAKPGGSRETTSPGREGCGPIFLFLLPSLGVSTSAGARWRTRPSLLASAPRIHGPAPKTRFSETFLVFPEGEQRGRVRRASGGEAEFTASGCASGGVPARGPGFSPDLCPPRAPVAPCFHPPETLQWIMKWNKIVSRRQTSSSSAAAGSSASSRARDGDGGGGGSRAAAGEDDAGSGAPARRGPGGVGGPERRAGGRRGGGAPRAPAQARDPRVPPRAGPGVRSPSLPFPPFHSLPFPTPSPPRHPPRRGPPPRVGHGAEARPGALAGEPLVGGELRAVDGLPPPPPGPPPRGKSPPWIMNGATG